MGTGPMVLLLVADGPFHAKLVAARLGSDGILTELRGAVDGPYPGMGPVYVYVPAEELETARQLREADVAAADEQADDGPRPVRLWLPVVAAVLLVTMVLARFL